MLETRPPLQSSGQVHVLDPGVGAGRSDGLLKRPLGLISGCLQLLKGLPPHIKDLFGQIWPDLEVPTLGTPTLGGCL